MEFVFYEFDIMIELVDILFMLWYEFVNFVFYFDNVLDIFVD